MQKRISIKEEKRQRIEDLLKQGVGITEICSRLHTGTATVTKIKRQLGLIPLPGRPAAPIAAIERPFSTLSIDKTPVGLGELTEILAGDLK
jgi:hypothetical protein